MTVSEALVLGPGAGRQFIAGAVKVGSDTADFSVFEGRPVFQSLDSELVE